MIRKEDLKSYDPKVCTQTQGKDDLNELRQLQFHGIGVMKPFPFNLKIRYGLTPWELSNQSRLCLSLQGHISLKIPPGIANNQIFGVDAHNLSGISF